MPRYARNRRGGGDCRYASFNEFAAPSGSLCVLSSTAKEFSKARTLRRSLYFPVKNTRFQSTQFPWDFQTSQQDFTSGGIHVSTSPSGIPSVPAGFKPFLHPSGLKLSILFTIDFRTPFYFDVCWFMLILNPKWRQTSARWRPKPTIFISMMVPLCVFGTTLRPIRRLKRSWSHFSWFFQNVVNFMVSFKCFFLESWHRLL